MLAMRRVGQIAVEERFEGVSVGDPKDAVTADQHVNVESIDVGAKYSRLLPVVENLRDEIGGRGAEATEQLGLLDVLTAEHVLVGPQPNEVRVLFVVVEGEFCQGADCCGGVQSLEVEFTFLRTNDAVRMLEDG